MNQTSTPDAVDRAISDYIASWNESDPERRRVLIARTWTEDGSYVDPHTSANGHDAIDELIGGAQQRFVGHSIVLAAGPDAHNDRVRFVWHLLGPEGDAPVAIGMDFAALAPDGRMRAVTGFRGPLE